MGKTLFGIYTSKVALSDVIRLITELDPSITVRSIIDDSLIAEVIANGEVTPGVLRRLCTYTVLAEQAGADLVLNVCSSVGEAADIAAKMIRIPLVKIDERMAEEACKLGQRIGVVATLSTTIGPTVRLIQKSADKLGRKVEISQELCQGAFEKLAAGDKQTHDNMVRKAISELTKKVDVVVCAQVSMHSLLPDLCETSVPVLSSPPYGTKHAVEILAKMYS
jgi:aspartate/glutamate racemase